jgi:RNA polymerase sigma-70 factor (ECF subfamily)
MASIGARDLAEMAEIADFDAIFRRFAPYVGRVALRIIGRPSEVDDVVQDVFIQAMRGLRGVRDPAAVKSWLVTVTVRACNRRLRRRRTRQWLGWEPLSELPPTSAPGASESERVAIVNLYRLLDRLPASERVAWTLRHLVGESLESTAALCDCSLATIKRRIAAAHARLQEGMRDG